MSQPGAPGAPGIPATPGLAERLRQRLDALGVAVVRVAPDGSAVLLGPARPLEQLLVAAPVFAAALRQGFPRLTDHAASLVPLFPGLWLVPLPTQRRRRAGGSGGSGAGARAAQPLVCALLLGSEVLHSEQLAAACDHQQLDFRATLTQVDPAALLHPAEARRLAATLTWMHEDALETTRRGDELQSLSQQLGDTYEELSLVYKLSSSMTVDQPPALFLTEACRDLQQVLGLRWMALQLIDHEPRLNELAGQVFTAGPVACDPELLKRIGRQLMLRTAPGSGPTVVEDTHSLHVPYLPRVASNLLVVSLQREERPLGILFGGDKLDGTHISSIDSKLANSLANSLTMFLDNMMLFEDMQAMFLGSLHALTSAIDAKDSYTHGHSERVATLARQLAAAAGLEEHTVERVYLAALVHDLGKIGVPEAVLCKAGHLTGEEFALIKAHPEIGARILQDIRQMHDLIPGVLHHHEMWNGRGYPGGLAGPAIPLFGRIICMADAFDAMCSNRVYRRSLAREHALAELRRCAGTQFDPQLVEVFLKMDLTQFFDLIQAHQQNPTGPIPALTVRWGATGLRATNLAPLAGPALPTAAAPAGVPQPPLPATAGPAAPPPPSAPPGEALA